MYIVFNQTAQLYLAQDNNGHWKTTDQRHLAKLFGSKKKAHNIIEMVGHMIPGEWDIYPETAELPSKSNADESSLEDELTECLRELSSLCELRTAAAVSRVSLSDKELTDVYHYIEFSKFNAAQGYNACRMLQDVLKKRRAAKNEAEAMLSLSSVVNGPLKKAVNAAPRKQYVPRIRKDLFPDHKS